jgi:hypothetical protein
MPILFSTAFKIKAIRIKKAGVFNALLDKDSHFFINLKRLQATNVPEFSESYNRINEYFAKIGLLLVAAQPNDKLYRSAREMFHFPEVNGINLGFSSGRVGSGFGSILEEQIISDAYQIIQAGSNHPEIFHLTSLFEENVGPDRLSDMIARLIESDIANYSRRIYAELGITPDSHDNFVFKQGIPFNPYKKNTPILLLPVEILHELPIARNWSDIDRVISENEAIRKEISEVVSEKWYEMASKERKKYLLEWLFKHPDRLQRVIESYRRSSESAYNIYSNTDYLIVAMLNEMYFTTEPFVSSLEAARHIIKRYKEWVEFHRGSEVLADVTSKKGEKTVQKTLYATAMDYCDINNISINPESDAGRGPVDFTLSRGTDKTVVEIKLTSNTDCVHGISIQIEEYAKSENTQNKVFVLVDNGVDSYRVDSVIKKRNAMLKKGESPADLFIIDARIKESASKYKPKK